MNRKAGLTIAFKNTQLRVKNIQKRSQSTNSQYSSSADKNSRYSYVG